MWTHGVTHHSAMKRFLSLFEQGPADTPHQKNRPPKVIARDDCSLHPGTFTEGWAEGEGVVGKGARATWMAATLRRFPVRSGLRPESDWLANSPDPWHPETEEEDKRQRCRAEGCYQSNSAAAQTERLQASLHWYSNSNRSADGVQLLQPWTFNTQYKKCWKRKKNKCPNPRWSESLTGAEMQKSRTVQSQYLHSWQ